MENEIANIEARAIMNIEDYAMTKENLLKQVRIVQDVMKSVMVEGEHYGKAFPGADKPSLLKPGAEKLNLTFRFAPKEKIERFDLPNGHREYEITCYIYSIVTGAYLGFGTGNCNTMETKYRFRDEERKCPQCGKETIIKGKEQYGGGWLCWAKKGGCGAKFKDDDPVIKDQTVGKVEYDNPADYYNTVKKIAKKRALVDGILTVTAASDIFTQDLEDLPNGIINGEVVEEKLTKGKKSSPKAQKGPKETKSRDEEGVTTDDPDKEEKDKDLRRKLKQYNTANYDGYIKTIEKHGARSAEHIIAEFDEAQQEALLKDLEAEIALGQWSDFDKQPSIDTVRFKENKGGKNGL